MSSHEASPLSVLLVIENSAKVAKDWMNLRDRYIRSTIDSLKASNTSIPMNIMVLPSLPLHKNNEQSLWNLLQRYGDLQDFEFNLYPGNRLSADHIYTGIEFLSSCSPAPLSSAERHIFILAATAPSESISGVEYVGQPVWSFLARKLYEANIYCHLIVPPIDELAPLSRLYEETLHLQGNTEHTFQPTPQSGSIFQPYSLRLSMQPLTQSTSSPAITASGPRVLKAQQSFAHTISKTTARYPNTGTDGGQNPGSQSQYPHGGSQKKAESLRSAIKPDSPTMTSAQAQTQGGRVTPSYKGERGSRITAMPRSAPDAPTYSPMGGKACHISSLTPGVTTLLPVPPAPVTRSMTKMQAQTLLPIPPAPLSTPRSLIPQTLLPVPPAPHPTPNSPQMARLRSQNLYTKEFIANSVAGMSAVLPVPPPPIQRSVASPPAIQSPKPQAPNNHPRQLEDEELIIDAFLDPNHHFTLDFFQTNLMPILDASPSHAKAILKDSVNHEKAAANNTQGDGPGAGFHPPTLGQPEEYTDSYPMTGYNDALTFPLSPRGLTEVGSLVTNNDDGLEARSTRSLPTPLLAGNYVASTPSPRLSTLHSPVEANAGHRTPKAATESLSSLRGWAG